MSDINEDVAPLIELSEEELKQEIASKFGAEDGLSIKEFHAAQIDHEQLEKQRKALEKKRKEKLEKPDYRNMIIANMPIKLKTYDKLVIQIPKIKQIIEVSFERYQKYLTVFNLTIDRVFRDTSAYEHMITNYLEFDMYFYKQNAEEYLLQGLLNENPEELFKEALKFFIPNIKISTIAPRPTQELPKAKVVLYIEGMEEKDGKILDLKTWRELKHIIQEITMSSDLQYKEEKYKSEYVRQNEQMIAEAKELKGETSIDLFSMINSCVWGNEGYVPFDEIINNWNFWQLKKAFDLIMEKLAYEEAFAVYISPKFDNKKGKIKAEHFRPSLMANKSNVRRVTM